MLPEVALNRARELAADKPPKPSRAAALPTGVEFHLAHIRPREGNERIPWSFDRHEYLRAIIEDRAPEIFIEKAAQLGVTEAVLGLCLDFAAQGYTGLYYLPTDDLVQPMVQDRVDPLIDADAALAGLVYDGDPDEALSEAAKRRRKRPDSTILKHVGNGSIWFRGLQKLHRAKSVAGDLVIGDETDELPVDFVDFIGDRTFHSSNHRIILLSQPSVPGFGIDAAFQQSDQKHFLLRCSRCRSWQCLEDTFPDCLLPVFPSRKRRGAEEDDASSPAWRLACTTCGASFSYLSRRGAPFDFTNSGRTVVDTSARPVAEWVPKRTESGLPSGYHMTQLYGPHMPAARIAAEALKAGYELSRGTLHGGTVHGGTGGSPVRAVDVRPSTRRLILRRPNFAKLRNFSISVLGKAYGGDRQPLAEEVISRHCDPDLHPSRARPADAIAVWAGIDVGREVHVILDAEFRPSRGTGVSPVNAPLATFYLDALSTGDQDLAALASLLKAVGCTYFVIDKLPETRFSKALCRMKGLSGAVCTFDDAIQSLHLGLEDEDLADPVESIKINRTEAIDATASEVLNGKRRFPSPRHREVQTFKQHCARLVKETVTSPRLRVVYKSGVENHYGIALTYARLAREIGHAKGLVMLRRLSEHEDIGLPKQDVRPSW